MRDSGATEPRRKLGRFRPIYQFYGGALFVSGAAVSETVGVWTACWIAGMWAVVFVSRSRRTMFALVFVVVGVYVLFSFPVIAGRGPGWRRSDCRHNLKQLGLALHIYHDEHKTFPPAVVTDEGGVPLHSWRTLVLPWLDEAPRYDDYDFGEAWDGPHNGNLTEEELRRFVCLGDHRTPKGKNGTNYVAVTGARTAWPGSRPSKVSDMADGASNTILLIECNTLEIPWAQPRDLELEDALDLLTSTDPREAELHASEDDFYEYPGGHNVLLADGSPHFIPHGTNRETWRKLLVIDDGVVAEVPWVDAGHERRPRRAKLGNHVAFWTFIALALFPLPWVFVNPRWGLAEDAAESSVGPS